jgi:hypothetical protein
MTLLRTAGLAALALAVPLATAGCSISASSESISKSVSSPFKWSSSSSPGDDDTGYKKEISDFTFAYARSSNPDVLAFRRGVGAIAERRGITDWEGDDDTLRAIGTGLRSSGLGRSEAQDFTAQLFAANAARAPVVLKGFDQAN